MKEFRGTPGEWEATALFRVVTDSVVVASAPGWASRHEEEAMANARLMAASKDLLKALQGMIDEDFPSLPFDEQERRLNAAEAAIDKALGS